MKNEMCRLYLKDGSVFEGKPFGATETKVVELVFNTSMVGYQEILSDPSYTDQAVVMTYPLIGNYGINEEDYETKNPSISGFVVRDYNDEPSNFRSKNSFQEIMKKYGVVGICDVDTRRIGRHIRDIGSCLALITCEDIDQAQAKKILDEYVPRRDAVARVSTKEQIHANTDSFYHTDKDGNQTDDNKKDDNAFRVVAIDCGIKANIVRMMIKLGLDVTLVPWNTSAEEIKKINPDGVFISNGPGDPCDVTQTIETIKELIGFCPIFGICLGHQIISLAFGAKTYKLKFGHRGGNHPVKNLLTDKIEITSQNHSYAVDVDSVEGTDLEITHINLLDNTVEGVKSKSHKVCSVQYHPESAPGPEDSAYLFDTFISMMRENKEDQKNA